MELKSIETGLEIVGLIVRNWRENDKMDEMERTLVVKKLKELSEAVNSLSVKPAAEQKPVREQLPDLFAQIQVEQSLPAKPQTVAVENTSFAQQDNNETDYDKKAEDKPDFEFIPDQVFENDNDMEVVDVDYAAESAMKPDFEFVPFADEQLQPEEKVGTEEQLQPEEQSVRASSSEEMGQSETVDVPEKTEQSVQTCSDDNVAAQTTEQKDDTFVPEKQADASLETDEDKIEGFHKHHKIDRKTINRLYGDDSVVTGRKYEAFVEKTDTPNKIDDAAEDDVLEEDFTVVTTPQPDVRESDSALEEDAAVLGDVLNAGRKVLGDAWGNAEKSDVSSVASGKLKSLHSALGINDIFLIANDLFDSDVKKCEEALNELEQMQNIDDALLYIHDNYNWDKKREGTKLIMDVLMRKLM